MQQSNVENASEVYISVDIEASGPIPGKYSMLSVGACVVQNRGLSFYQEIRPLNMNFVPEALRISGLSPEDLAVSGAPPEQSMKDFHKWITEVCTEGSPVFVGFNAAFDWSFVNWYFHEFLGENPFGFGGVDIKSYYMGMTGATWFQSSFSQLPPEFQPYHQQTHNALDDAISQAEIFEQLIHKGPERRYSR